MLQTKQRSNRLIKLVSQVAVILLQAISFRQPSDRQGIVRKYRAGTIKITVNIFKEVVSI